MKNLVTLFVCLFSSLIQLSAQGGFALVDIVKVPLVADHIPRTPQILADANGGSSTFEVKYTSSGSCRGQFRMDWSFNANVEWLDDGQIINVNLKATSGEEPCGYYWVHGTAGGAGNIHQGVPGYTWTYNGNTYTSGLNNVNKGRIEFAPGGVRTASQEIRAYKLKYVEYTAFYIDIDGHRVYYVYQHHDHKPQSSGSCETGNCGSLYNMSINAGATHIRLGANHPRSEVLSNLDNTITSAKHSGCFDTQYLEELRRRIASEGRSTSSYRTEFETWMHGIPAQVAQDCPCCLPCGEGEGTTIPSCPTPSAANFEVIKRTETKLHLHSHADGLAWRWKYTVNGIEKTVTDDDPIFHGGSFPASASLTFMVQVQCASGEWSDWSSQYSTSTAGSSTVCAKPNIDDWIVSKRTSDAITIDANIDASEYQWTWFINGKTYTPENRQSVGYRNIPSNTEVVIYLKVKCSNGEWSEESDRYVIYTKVASSSRSRSYNPASTAQLIEEVKGQPISVADNVGDILAINIHPNPASDYLKIGGDFTEMNVQILTMEGKEVSTFEGTIKGEQLDISHLNQGMYAVLLSNDATSESKTLIVTR